ncbi:MAG: outer membrane protein assembly factor BamE [Aquabacterium sp.]|nr:outer membrane protein assembly factor BamE [Aquabacterium sp.]
MMRTLLMGLLLAATALLSACDTERAARLEEGISTEADVRRQFGEPVQTTERADGSKLLAYPRQPEGWTNYEAEIGADGKLAALRQLLTEANFAKVQPGMAQAAVARLLGRHARELRYATQPGQVVWRWHVQRGQDKKVFDVAFDADGRVLQTTLGDDERQTQAGG